MAAFGLAIALTSPTSVVTVIVLLSMPAGLKRAIAFICGWLLTIGLLAVLTIFVLHGQDFSSTQTTPSRAASAAEILLGAVLVYAAFRLSRREAKAGTGSTPGWLGRLDRVHWSLAFLAGVVMLTYSLTLAAAAEILKANVSKADAAAAAAVFALTSIVTIAAPVALVVLRPERSAEVLSSWRTWLLAHARSIALIVLAAVGVYLIVRGIVDLA